MYRNSDQEECFEKLGEGYSAEQKVDNWDIDLQALEKTLLYDDHAKPWEHVSNLDAFFLQSL